MVPSVPSGSTNVYICIENGQSVVGANPPCGFRVWGSQLKNKWHHVLILLAMVVLPDNVIIVIELVTCEKTKTIPPYYYMSTYC